MTEDIATAVITAHVVGIDCPYCDCFHDGFVGDPRGSDIECEDCGKTFHIDDKDVNLS